MPRRCRAWSRDGRMRRAVCCLLVDGGSVRRTARRARYRLGRMRRSRRSRPTRCRRRLRSARYVARSPGTFSAKSRCGITSKCALSTTTWSTVPRRGSRPPSPRGTVVASAQHHRPASRLRRASGARGGAQRRARKSRGARRSELSRRPARDRRLAAAARRAGLDAPSEWVERALLEALDAEERTGGEEP